MDSHIIENGICKAVTFEYQRMHMNDKIFTFSVTEKNHKLVLQSGHQAYFALV